MFNVLKMNTEEVKVEVATEVVVPVVVEEPKDKVKELEEQIKVIQGTVQEIMKIVEEFKKNFESAKSILPQAEEQIEKLIAEVAPFTQWFCIPFSKKK